MGLRFVIACRKRGACLIVVDCTGGMAVTPWKKSLVSSEERFRSECEVRELGVGPGGTLQRLGRVEIGGLFQWCVEHRDETTVDG